MPTPTEKLDLILGRRREIPPPGVLARLLAGAEPVFNALDWGARQVRAAVGAITGLETPGRAPSGEQLFEHLFDVKLPPNVEGKIEWRDVPGAAMEMALDPIMYIGVGGLSKAGRLSKRLDEALRTVRSLEATGQGASAAARAARRLAAQLRTQGVHELGATLGEQGRLGQRSLLSLNLPFTETHIPLPLLGGRTASRFGLGGIGAVGRGIEALAEPVVGPLFRSGGRVRPRLTVERGPFRATGEEYNALISLGREGRKRLWARRGLEESERVRATMAGWNKAELDEALQRLRTDLPDMVESTIEKVPLLARLQQSERDALARNAPKTAERWARLQQKLRNELHAALDPMQGLAAGDDAAQTLLRIGIERGPAIERIERLSEEVTKEYAARIDAHNAAAKAVMERAGGGANREWAVQRAAQHTAAASRLERTMLDKLGVLAAEKELTEAIWQRLPDTVRAEAARYSLVTDDALRIAQQIGVRISELQDLHLGYMHRAVNHEAIELQRQLAQHGVKGWMVQFAMPAASRVGITRRRIRALETMGISQINDAWERGIKDLIAGGVPIRLPGGKIPPLFIEDPAEVMFRRLTNQGLPEGKAALMRGIAENFAVPEQWARPDDMPISEFFEKARLGAVRALGPGKGRMRPIPKSATQIANALADTKWAGMYIPQEFAAKALEVFRVGQQPKVLRDIGRLLDSWLSMLRYWVTAAAVKVPGLRQLGVGGGALAGGTVGGLLGGPLGAALGAGLGAVGGHIGALPLFPTYHTRNAGSNLVNMWLGGFRLRDMPLLADAARIQLKYERALADPAFMQQLVKAGDKDLALIQQAQDQGAYWASMTAELAEHMAEAGTLHAPRVLPQPIRAAADHLLAPATTPTGKAALRYAQFIENNAKLAMYMQGLKKGLTPVEAAERVKKYLFDYTELGPFEKRYLRRWAFFYTWVRKNMALQWSQLIEQPRRMALIGRATGLIGDSEQKKVLREHERVRLPVLGGLGKGTERVFWGLGLPQEDLMLLSAEGRPGLSGVQRVGQKLLSQAAPHLRDPLEAILGVNLASGRPAPVSRAILAMTPFSRMTSSVRTLADDDRRKRWGLVLGTPYVRTPERARLLRELDRLDALAAEEFAAGRARQWTGYAALPGTENERLAAITKRRRRVEERLSKVR